MSNYKHQQKIIDDDKKKTLLALGTGSGKTRIALSLARGKTLVICKKTQRDDKNWEREKEKMKLDLDLTVLSKEDFRRDAHKLPSFDTIIGDECFVAGTKIKTIDGYKNIEDIKTGDLVYNAIGVNKVVSTFSKDVNDIYVVKLSNGRVIETTDNHPFYTQRGWVETRDLKNSDLLMSYDMLQWEYENNNKRTMCNLWKADSKRLASWWAMGTIQKNLFRRMQKSKNERGAYFNDERISKKYKKMFKTIFRKNEKKQSNEESKNKNEDGRNIKKNWTQTKNSRWKRENYVSSTKNVISGTWGRVVCRACGSDSIRLSTEPLQARHSSSKKTNSNRSRWFKSLCSKSANCRQEKDRLVREVRVESIKIQKRPGTKVFNFGVKGHQSYFVEDILVHNCHSLLGVTPNVRYVKKQPIPKASQLFDRLKEFIDRTKPTRLYLATATIEKNPMTVWAAGVLLNMWDYNTFYQFRDIYYIKLPMGGRREVYGVRHTQETKERLAKAVRRIGYIGRLEDFFDVPDQTYHTEYVEPTKEQKDTIKDMILEYPDPIVQIGKRHQIDNGVLKGNEYVKDRYIKDNKIARLIEYSYEFPKMILFIKYTAQINKTKEALEKEGKKVFIMNGATKDRGTLLDKLSNLDEYVFIVQATISEGWELKTCPVVIFVSRDYSLVHYIQGQGRVQRADHIKKNLYINLLTRYNGSIDMAVDKSLNNKMDFSKEIYATSGK